MKSRFNRRFGLRYFGFSAVFFAIALSVFAVPKDQRIEIVHIANLRGDYQRLARLLTFKDGHSSGNPTIFLIGSDVTGVSAYSDVDNQGRDFVRALVDFAEEGNSVIIPGRSDLAQPVDLLKDKLATLKKDKLRILASNYEGPLKGLSKVETLRVAGAKIAVISLLRPDPALDQHEISNPQIALKAQVKDIASKVDGVVVVTNLGLGDQRLLAKSLSSGAAANKILGIFGAEAREKSAEIVSADRGKILIHQASATSNQLTSLSVYWDQSGERSEKVVYENLPEISSKRGGALRKLDQKLRGKYGEKIGIVDAAVSGPENVDALFSGISPLGQLIANAYREKLQIEKPEAKNLIGLTGSNLVGKSLVAGELTQADLMKVLPLNANLQVVELTGSVLEKIIRQDQAQQASRQEAPLQWSDNIRVSDNGSISINRKKLDPQAKYLVVVDTVTLGQSSRSLASSSRGRDLFGTKDLKAVTPDSWKQVTERAAVADFIRSGLKGEVLPPQTGKKKPTNDEPSSKAAAVDPRETRYFPAQKSEIERISSHAWSVVWVENFPEGNKPNDLLIVDPQAKVILGVARLASFAYGQRKEVLSKFEVGHPIRWNEENAGPEDRGKYYGLLITDYRPFPKPMELARLVDATGNKQFSLRNRLQPEAFEWLRSKGLVVERAGDQAKAIREAVRLFGDPQDTSDRLSRLKEKTSADAALVGVYHSFCEPEKRPAVFEVTGAQLKAFFARTDARLFQSEGLKFDRQRRLKEIDGEEVKDRKKYRIAADFSDETGDFEKTFAEGGKTSALASLREVATSRALEALRGVVNAADVDEAEVSRKPKSKKKAEAEEDELTIKPIRLRTKEMRRQLYDVGILMYPDGERVDTGGEVQEMPEDILFQRSYRRMVDRLNPYDPESVRTIQRAISVLAQIEVISRLTEDSLQTVRETSIANGRTCVEGLLTEVGSFPEDLRQVFKNPLITLRLSGYRPTVEEADLLTQYYRAKPEDYEPIFERWVEFAPMREVVRDKLKVTPVSFFSSPSSTTLQHHDPVQHFPDGQAVHDQNVLNVMARRLELEGFDRPTIEGMILAMLAHDGWSHEPSPTNWFFKQFGLAGSRAVLKGSVDLMTLFFPDFEDFLKAHPHVKREELELFTKQFDSIRERIGSVKSTNLRSDIKRMMIGSPFLALSDLKPSQETWFIKNLAAYVCVQIIGPKAYRNVQDLIGRGVQEFSVREIVRNLIQEEFGGLDGANVSDRPVLSRRRQAFTPKGAEWIENKVLDYVLCNAFGPILEKRFDFSTTFVSVNEVLKQALPKLPEDELKLVHRMLIQEPSFRQPYGKELGRGGWDIGHPSRLRAEMERRLPVVCQMIRARGWEEQWMARYGARWGKTLEETLQNMHDQAVSHMGAYQEAVEVVHRTYANAGINPDRLLHKLWTWTDVGGFLFNRENVLHQLALKANQIDTLESLGYLSFERSAGAIPDREKIRITREVSLAPKDGFVLVDKVRAAPRGRTFLEFKKATGNALESTEYLRQYVCVTLRDAKGRNITSDPRLADMVWDFTNLVPGEIDAKFAVNAAALLERKEARKDLVERKRKRAEKEKEQDQSNREKLERYQTVLQAMAETDPESLEKLEDEFGISKGEVKKLLKVKREDDWIEFIRNRAKLVSRLDSMTETSRPSHKAIKSKALTGDELALRVAPDRVAEIRQNEEEAAASYQRDAERLLGEKEAVYLASVREMVDREPRKFKFLADWSGSSQIGFKLCTEKLGEKVALDAVRAGASAGVFDVLYGNNFSFPLFGPEGVEALEGVRLFVNEASEGRLDGAHSAIRTLRGDPVRVMNFFRRFRVCHLAGIRGLKKMAADASLSSSHIIGIEAVLEEAVDRQGLEKIAGFEVPIEMAQESGKGRAVRVADILLKPDSGPPMQNGRMIEVKNYTPRSYFDYLHSSILPQFEADIKLHKGNLDRLMWIFRGVDRETGHVLVLFEEIMKRHGISAKKIENWMDNNLIFRGESGHYPKFDTTQLTDLRVQGCRALNDQWYAKNPVLEDQRVQEVLQLPKRVFKPELSFNWGAPNKVGEDLGAQLIDVIGRTTGELSLAFYDLEDVSVVDALIKLAKKIGPENIPLVLEGSNFQEVPWKTSAEVDFYLQGLPQHQRIQFLEQNADGGDHLTQTQLDRLRARNDLRVAQLRRLKKAGLEPRLVKNKNQIMHIKVAVRDRKEALILTANPTQSDLYGDFSPLGKKLAPANVNASFRLVEPEMVGFIHTELDQLQKGLTTKTSRDLSGSTRTFVDKNGTKMTIGFTPFSGQGDMANVFQGVLADLQVEEIWAQQFSFSDSRLYGILYPHIERGAKRRVLVDDHFLKFYSKAWQLLGLTARDPQGRPIVDRVTRLPLEGRPLAEGEFVGTWNGRVDETKGIEAKEHLKLMFFKAKRPGVQEPVYILSIGSGNASRLGVTTNNEIWIFMETTNPDLFYSKCVEQFENRVRDEQTSDLSLETAKALLQTMADPESKPLIDYLQGDDYGKKSIDSVPDELATSFEAVVKKGASFRDFAADLEKRVGLKIRPEAQILFQIWYQAADDKDVSEFMNLADAVLVKSISEAERAAALRRIFDDAKVREHIQLLAKVVGGSSEEILKFLGTKGLKIPANRLGELTSELGALKSREQNRSLFFDPTGNATVTAKADCKTPLKKVAKKKSSQK